MSNNDQPDGFGDQSNYPYGPTNHPEDAPGGFQGSTPNNHSNGGGYSANAGQPYGQNPYPQQYPYQGYGANSPAQGTGIPVEAGTGKVDIMRAVRFGFRTTFSNPLVWIVGTVVLGLAYVLLSGLGGMLAYALDPAGATSGSGFTPASMLINLISIVLMLVVTLCVIRGALVSLDGQKTRYADFFHPQNVGQSVILLIILGVFSSLLGMITSTVMLELIQIDEASGSVAVDPSTLGLVFLCFLVLFLIGPLYAYWVYYTSDGHHTALSAVRTGFKDALRNYPRLLLFSVISGVLMVLIGIVTLFLAFIILVPAMMLANAHIYRQMSGGNIPVEQR